MGMKAYKGFDKGMKCRGFQFEEGKTYKEKEAELCKKGFHACQHPLNCFKYYPPATSVYHEVEMDGVSDDREDDTKIVGRKITVGARLSIADLVKAAVEFTFSKAKWTNGDRATGYQGAASATGYQGAASATGYHGAASATGDQGAASATGDHGAASATGYQGVASSLGIDGKAKGAVGGWIVCAEWAFADDVCQRIDVKCAKVDGETIKPDTWYRLKGGVFVEVSDEE